MAMMRTTRLLIGVSCVAVIAAAVGVHVGRGALLSPQTSPKAHWEPYKTRKATPWPQATWSRRRRS